MIRTADIIAIAKIIEQTQCFKGTENLKGPNNEDWCYAYNAREMFGTIIVQCDYSDGTENSTEFMVYDRITQDLRTCTPEEDEALRNNDQGEYPFLEGNDTQFVIGKDENNKTDLSDFPQPTFKVMWKCGNVLCPEQNEGAEPGGKHKEIGLDTYPPPICPHCEKHMHKWTTHKGDDEKW